MNTKQSVKIVVLEVILIVIASSICLSPLQSDGKCTACISVEVLINGTCYPKITGCLKQQAGRKCAQCQFGYVLSNGGCIREGVFYNRTNLSYIPPVLITNNQTLTIQQIKTKIGQQFGYVFSNVHEYFLYKYTSQIGAGNIKDVQKIETKTGIIFIIIYQGQSLNRFEAVAKIGLDNKIQQWSFSTNNFQKRDPFTAITKVQKTLANALKDYILHQVRQQKDSYVFDYRNRNFDFIRVTVNKNDIDSSNFESKINSQSLTLTDLALQALHEKFPSYKEFQVTDTKKYDKYYVVSLGPSISFSYKFDNNVFTINEPIDNPQGSRFPRPTEQKDMPGGFSQFTDLFDSRLQTAAKLAAKQFPEIGDSKIFQAQSQVVSGTNFFIRLRKPITFDSYQFLIWVKLNGLAEMIQARKNQALIYQRDYNYNNDPTFLNNFNIVEVGSRIANVPPISQVTYKLTGNKKYYKVKFSDRQFAEFQYNGDLNKATLLSYYIDGQNILITLPGSLKSSTQRSPDVLLNFIKSKNSGITQAKIEKIQLKLPTYTINLVTNLGKYRAEVFDKGGQLLLNQFVKISDITCANLDTSQTQNQQKIKIFDDFLRKNYPITGYQIKLVQINLRPSSIVTRILYANSEQKQIQIFIQEANGQANVLRATFLNYAYGTVPINPSSLWYSKITSLFAKTNSTPKDPLYVQSNGTILHSYYDDGKTTYQTTTDLTADKTTSQPVAVAPYVLVPQGFSVQDLIIPGGSSTTEDAIVKKINQEALSKFSAVLANANIVFASKTNNSYQLMYKNSLGYQRLDANVSAKGDVTLGKIVITSYKDSDFSNCRKFDRTGKCLSCLNSQVEYQGYCYKKLEGCRIQAGKICAKCQLDYVKSNNLCYKQCSSIFK